MSDVIVDKGGRPRAKAKHPYVRWTDEGVRKLTLLYDVGMDVTAIAEVFNTGDSAIRSAVKRFRLTRMSAQHSGRVIAEYKSVRLTSALTDYYNAAAAERGVTINVLVKSVLATIMKDSLLKAIIDD